jgi:hypothetical protein
MAGAGLSVCRPLALQPSFSCALDRRTEKKDPSGLTLHLQCSIPDFAAGGWRLAGLWIDSSSVASSQSSRARSMPPRPFSRCFNGANRTFSRRVSSQQSEKEGVKILGANKRTSPCHVCIVVGGRSTARPSGDVSGTWVLLGCVWAAEWSP